MKLCLIGSSRFKDLYVEANKSLTLKGHVVYSIATVSSSEGMELPVDMKTVLDLVHLRKIHESEASVLITDDTGYYGMSTKREMLWGIIISKPLFIYVPRPGRNALLVHVGMPGIQTIDGIPSIESVAEIIAHSRSCETGASFEIPRGEA